jgi:polyisoprenoid-binding protein YceI
MLHRRTFHHFATALLLSTPLLASAEPYTGVVVFLPKSAEPALEGFRTETLPQLQTLAQEMNLPLRLEEAGATYPAEITSLPAIVFQNERGRSVFQGRNRDVGKIRHFLTTSKSIPQGKDKLTYSNAYVFADGRTVIVGNTKITHYTGREFTAEELQRFEVAAAEGIARGLAPLAQQPTVALDRTDRVFYFDFYPYIDAQGNVYLSSALFSLFNCHVPVSDYRGNPTVGTEANLSGAFEEAARRLLADLRTVQATSTLGDGFEVIPASAETVTWESINLALPENPGDAVDLAALNAGVHQGRWVLDTDAALLIQFGFPAPLDRYQGVVTAEVAELDTTNGLAQATGTVRVPTKSATLGESDLDFHVHQSVLRISRNPISTFTLTSLGTEKTLQYGEALQTQATGTLNLVGVDLPITMLVELTPILVGPADDLKANTRLLASASWEFRLSEPFGILGPDGPAPANDTLTFFASLTMKPE